MSLQIFLGFLIKAILHDHDDNCSDYADGRFHDYDNYLFYLQILLLSHDNNYADDYHDGNDDDYDDDGNDDDDQYIQHLQNASLISASEADCGST